MKGEKGGLVKADLGLEARICAALIPGNISTVAQARSKRSIVEPRKMRITHEQDHNILTLLMGMGGTLQLLVWFL